LPPKVKAVTILHKFKQFELKYTYNGQKNISKYGIEILNFFAGRLVVWKCDSSQDPAAMLGAMEVVGRSEAADPHGHAVCSGV
jgi:hypothetical protein